MTDSNRVLLSVTVGALLGGVAAHLLFTPRGRRMLAQVNPALDDLLVELQELRRAIGKAGDVTHETRAVIEDLRTLSRGAPASAL